MRYLTLTNSNFFSFRQQKRTANLKLKSGPYTLAIVLIILICVLSLFFLAQVFQSSTSGYEVTKLQKQVDELKEKNKDLEIKAAELRSFDKIADEAKKLNMVQSNKIVYLQAKKTTEVAINQ